MIKIRHHDHYLAYVNDFTIVDYNNKNLYVSQVKPVYDPIVFCKGYSKLLRTYIRAYSKKICEWAYVVCVKVE